MIARSYIESGKKGAVVVLVALFCYAATAYTDLSIFQNFFPERASSLFTVQFEHHFWQFVLSFTAVAILSRGHLWSYGINSNNLKRSMQWLGLLYMVIIIASLFSLYSGIVFSPMHHGVVPANIEDVVLSFLISWMSSPVANQILFYSFAQTLLMKIVIREGNTTSVYGVIIITSILFGILGTDPLIVLGPYPFVSKFLLGLFCGTVYWKTGSLITPMLGHAFVYGFPIFISTISFYFS